MRRVERVRVRGLRVGVLAILGALVCAPAAHAKEKPVNGQALYMKYCASCHGADGKGGGTVAKNMQPPPTDLTQLAKKHGGSFNDVAVMDVIKGTNTIRAHGDPTMPVWGEIFYQPSTQEPVARARVQSKVIALTQYLRSIQEK